MGCGNKNPTVPIHGNRDKKSNQNYTNASDFHSKLGWTESLPIPYYISKDVPAKNAEQIQIAILTWEKAVGKKLFDFKGRDERGANSFPDGQLFSPLQNPINSQYFFPQWTQKTLKDDSTLATTIWYNGEKKETIVRASTLYNTQHYILGDALTESGEGKKEIVDLISLAIHEIGHLLGLNHNVTDKFSVMNPLLTIGEGATTRRLSRGDINRSRSIYGVGDPTLANTLEIADDFPKTK